MNPFDTITLSPLEQEFLQLIHSLNQDLKKEIGTEAKFILTFSEDQFFLKLFINEELCPINTIKFLNNSEIEINILKLVGLVPKIVDVIKVNNVEDIKEAIWLTIWQIPKLSKVLLIKKKQFLIENFLLDKNDVKVQENTQSKKQNKQRRNKWKKNQPQVSPMM